MNEMIDISKLETYSKPHKVYIPSKHGSFVKSADLEQLLETAQNSDYAVTPSASPKSCATCNSKGMDAYECYCCKQEGMCYYEAQDFA